MRLAMLDWLRPMREWFAMSCRRRPIRRQPIAQWLHFTPLESRVVPTMAFNQAFALGAVINDFAVDAAGNQYLVGGISQAVDFDPGPGLKNKTPSGLSDVFVAKYTAQSSLVWVKTYTSANAGSGEAANSVTVDAAGSVFVSGFSSFSLNFDGQSLPETGGFTIKLGSDGAVQWLRSGQSANALGVDAAGNVYSSGTFSGTKDFDPGAGVANHTSAGSLDVYVLKLNSAGNFVWVQQFGGPAAEGAARLAVDPLGNVAFTGAFTGSITAGGTTITSAGGSDAYVARLAPDGNYSWIRRFGSVDGVSEFGAGVAVTADGNTYVTGQFAGNATSDSIAGAVSVTCDSTIMADVFAARLDGSGLFQWARSIAGPVSDRSCDVGVDALGNAYVVGGFSRTADFDPLSGVEARTASSTSQDVFVWKLDLNGDFVSATTFGGTGSDVALRVELDPLGHVGLLGNFTGTVDFDPGPDAFSLTSSVLAGQSVGSKMFVLKLNQEMVYTIPATGTATNISLRLSNGDLRIVDSDTSEILMSQPIADTSQVRINGVAGQSDTLTVEGFFSLANGVVFNGNGGDTLRFSGVSAELDITPDKLSSSKGDVALVGGLNKGNRVFFTGVDQIDVEDSSEIRLFFKNKNDVLLVSPADAADGRPATKVEGASGGLAMTPFVFTGVPSLFLCSDEGDWDATGRDEITILHDAFQANGLGNVSIVTGGGNDKLISYLARFTGPTVSWTVGPGLDTLVAGPEGDLTLTNTGLQASAGGKLQFQAGAVDFVTLLGDPTDNKIDASAFTAGRVTLMGGDGDDVLIPNSPACYINGGPGNDKLTGGNGNDTIFGGEGSDTIAGGNGHDSLSGSDGDDSIVAGAGNDTIEGGEGDNHIDAGAGKNIVYAGAGDDQIVSGNGSDYIDAGEGDNAITASGGSNTIIGGDGSDRITTGSDNDVIDAGDGNNHLDSGAGNDRITAASGNDDINAGTGNDWIASGDGTDTIFAGNGNDTLYAGRGDDSIFGGDGNDFIDAMGDPTSGGATFFDTILDYYDDDFVNAGNGNDYLIGGDGNDTLLGGSGRDTLDGGRGDDSLSGGDGADYFFAGVSGDHDSLYGGLGTDTLVSDTGADVILEIEVLLSIGGSLE